MKESLKRADDLYRQGKYQEAYDLAVPCDQKLDPEGCAEACRIRAWAKYYIAIKGNPEEKIRNAGHAAGYASVVSISIDPKRRLSAYNVLPLALWISGNQSGAWEASDEALQEFPEEPSAWNTRGILARWAKDYEQGVIIGDRVTDRSVARGDFLTAGHGQQNKGDALRALGRIGEAHTAYEEALKRYRQHEHSSGKSATPHIVNAEKKLAEVSK
ncbi:MAG TPA: hypothetical protein PLB38_04240 [bacterium]|jgi:tetratricopeptide (TPR) repeat protein|nr:hypothetical protein [Candidatus Pacearchaeota archaeon]HPL93465.1 hypothetical protein [bacterium]